MWQSRIRRKSHIPSQYHIPSICPICMVQILSLKREIRIAFSRNGSIRLLKWNRNVIWNQCIRTCLDISTKPLYTFHPSLSLSLSLRHLVPLHLSLVLPVLARHLHQNRNGVEEQAWIRPKRGGRVGQTAASHARATMKIKSAKDVWRRGGWGVWRKGKKAKIHSTSYGSHFHSLCTANV